MNDRVKKLLNIIGDKYPRERKLKSERCYEDLWNFAKPFIGPPITIHRGVIRDGLVHPAYHSLEEKEKTLEYMLQHIVNMADLDDDYIPVLTLDTGAYIIGNAFGARPLYREDKYLIEPFIHRPEDIVKLPTFDPDRDNFYMNKVFEMFQFMKEETEGKININIHTPQGPLDTLSTMWESSNFMISLRLNPEEVIQGLEKVTEAIIYYIKKQSEILGDDIGQYNFAMNYNHRPKGTGIGIGEDIIALISPEAFKILIPFYKEISAHFGNLLIHSCGNPSHQLDNICNMEGITGLHLSQLKPEQYFDKITKALVVQSRNDWDDFKDVEYFVKQAKRYKLRFNIQIQSLEKYMQVGDHTDSYDLDLVKKMLKQVKNVVNILYDGS